MANIISCPPDFNDIKGGVEIPGVGFLKAAKQKLDETPSPGDLASSALGQVQPALAPVVQILRVVQVLLNVIETLKAVPNPFKLKKELKKLAKSLTVLTSFVPGLPYVRTTRDFIDLAAAILHQVASLIDRWVSETQQVSNALLANNVVNDPQLTIIINCSKGSLVRVVGGTSAGISDLGQALKIVQELIGIIKNFVPGDIAKDIVTVIEKVVAIPTTLATVGASIESAESSDELTAVVTTLRDTQTLISEIADRLDSFSATLSSFVGP